MPTDDERREVARRLRERAGKRILNFGELFWCIDCDDGDDAAAWNRLADLIEPACDRDALVALAEEMIEAFRLGAFTGEGLDTKWCRELHGKYARRVREALGVES